MAPEEGLTAWRVYLYAVSFIALIVAILGAVNLIAIGIEVFVYPAPRALPGAAVPPRNSPGAWRRSWWGLSSGGITGCCSEKSTDGIYRCRRDLAATSSPAAAAAAPNPGSGVGGVSAREVVGGVTETEK